MKYDKYIFYALTLIVCLQIWFVTQIHDIRVNNAIRGGEVVRLRDDVRSMKAQFDEIIFDLAFRRAQEIIKLK